MSCRHRPRRPPRPARCRSHSCWVHACAASPHPGASMRPEASFRRGGLLRRLLVLAALSGLSAAALAQNAPPATVPLIIGQGAGGSSYSVPIQTLLFFTALGFLPAVLLMMTGFTRIVIVLSLMRQALGT
eukprot:Opistho-2@21469